jgi:hypothetical protein
MVILVLLLVSVKETMKARCSETFNSPSLILTKTPNCYLGFILSSR